MNGRVPRISVVIPTRQRRGTLEATLQPLLREAAMHELIVVCDGSTDGTAEMVLRLAERDPRVRLLQTSSIGANGARLAGAQIATGELLLLLDDDVLAGPGLVGAHAAGHAETPRLVLVGYMPVAPGKRRRGGYPKELYARAYERHCARWEAHPDRVLSSLWAGNMSIARADLLAVGSKVDLIANGYHEDLELGLWLFKLGLTGRFDRRLGATHDYSRSPAAFARDALSSGAGLVQIHSIHGDVLGPLDEDFALNGLSRPARWLLIAARTHSWPRRMLTRVLPPLGALRLFAVERYAGMLLKRTLQQQASRRARL